MCEVLLDAKMRAEDAAFRQLTAFIFREFEMTTPSSPKAAVRRCCCVRLCSLTGHIQGALPLSRLLKEQKSGFPRHVLFVCGNRDFSRWKYRVPYAWLF